MNLAPRNSFPNLVSSLFVEKPASAARTNNQHQFHPAMSASNTMSGFMVLVASCFLIWLQPGIARAIGVGTLTVNRSTNLIRFLKKTGRFVLGLVTIFALTSCDKWVYSSAELESKRKFESVNVGLTEHDLILKFGAPDLLIQRDKGSGQLMCERNSISKACDAFGSVDELKFLPRNKVGQKAYVYVEGSVFSYYFVGSNGLVEALDVFVT